MLILRVATTITGTNEVDMDTFCARTCTRGNESKVQMKTMLDMSTSPSQIWPQTFLLTIHESTL